MEVEFIVTGLDAVETGDGVDCDCDMMAASPAVRAGVVVFIGRLFWL